MTLPPHRAERELPAWPLLGLFVGFPVLWLVGVGSFLAVVGAGVQATYLCARGAVRFPRSMLLWWLFVVVVILSGAMLDSGGRVLGLAFRLANYVGAGIALVYLYNASRERLSDERVALALTLFWVWIVLGGYLGVLLPEGSVTTLLARVTPGSLMSNELVRDWVISNFSEIQQPWGAPEPFARPSAPFAYTNAWGNNFALLMPFVVATASRLRGHRRILVGAAVLASAVPVMATLNRGMLIGLGIGAVYAVGRAALRGRPLALIGGVAGGAVVTAGFVALGLFERITQRTTYSSTTEDRASLYRETFERTLGSPVVGWGGPRPSYLQDISVGTQGHVWNVLFSHGFLGLALFMAFLCWMVWRTRGCTGVGAAAHVTLVMVAFMVVFYGFDGPQLLVAFVAAGIGMRQRSLVRLPQPSWSSLTAAPAEVRG